MRADVIPLEGVRAIVLATDGLSEQGIGVADPGAAVAEALHQAEATAPELRAACAARRVAERALASHREQRSGDNLACAVVWIE